MKPLSTGAFAGLLFAGALIQGTSAAAVNLDATLEYDSTTCGSSDKVGSISIALTAAAVASGGNPATAAGETACSLGSCSASGVIKLCTTDGGLVDYISSKMTTPFVTISTFTGSTVCLASKITTSKTYAADGACHPLPADSKYFKVLVGANGATPVATIKVYTDPQCTLGYDQNNDIPVTKAQTDAGCTIDSANSIQYKLSSNYPFAMKAATSFDGTECNKLPNVVSLTSEACTTDSACTAGSTTSGVTTPAAGTICTTNLNYDSTISSVYGSTPFVTVSTYSDGTCAAAKLVSAQVYAATADGKCRVITANTKYYKTTITAGLDTLTIQFFSNSQCTAALTGNDKELAITQKKLGCDGTSKKYTYSGDLATKMGAVTTYDTDDCGTLGFMSVATGTTCTKDTGDETTCTSGAGQICTSNYNLNYESVIAAKFGSTPYLTVAKFSAGECKWPKFSSAKAYLADGNCHKYSGGYYNVSALPIGGVQEPKIYLWNDNKCTDADTTSTVDDVTRANLIAVNGQVTGCDGAGAGASLYKVSASWPKAFSVVGLGAYTVPTGSAACVGGTPSRLTLTDGTSAACEKTRKCASKTALADCTNTADYKTYLKTAFASVPYLVKETHTASDCGTPKSVVAWAADGTCYVDGTNSFKVVATSTGVSIRTWKSNDQCTTSSTVTPTDESVTATNLVGSTCIPGTSNTYTKYYTGGSWVFASYAAYDDSKCALTPSKLSFSPAPSTCTTPTGDAACASTTATTTSATDAAKIGYTTQDCTKTTTSTEYFSAIDKAFGMTTYVVQEKFTSCGGSLAGVTAYVADAACHLSGDAASSYNVTYDPSATAKAAVKIDTFKTLDCTGTAATSGVVTPAALTAHTCDATDFTKTYVGGLATQLTAVTIYSDKLCTLPVQTVFTGTASTCTASTACITSGTVFTKTACTSAKSDYNAILAAIYGTARRLVSDIYEAKDTNKCGTRQGIMAYVGDGVCHTALDGTSFTAAPGSSNTATDATFTAYTDKNCTKEPKAVTIASANLATATTAPCDNANSNGISMKWSISGTEPTDAPTTAPTPAPTTAVSTGSGKSAAVSSFSVSIFGLLASIIGGLAVLLN